MLLLHIHHPSSLAPPAEPSNPAHRFDETTSFDEITPFDQTTPGPHRPRRSHLNPWQSLAPQTRILTVLLLLLAIVSTPNGEWMIWAIYGLGVLSLLLVVRVSGRELLQRLAVESAFVGVVLLGTLFREGGTTLWQWGWFRITTVGLVVLGSVSCKALLSLLLLNLLILSTPVPVLLQALVALRTPPLLVAILASMYRYLHVLSEEFRVMARAAAARNLTRHPNWYRLVVGNMIGSLFIRTYERGERIYQAMLARGYRGQLSRSELPPPGRRDRLALTLVATFALLPQGILLLP